MSGTLIKPLLYQDEAKDKDGNKAIPLADVELSKKVEKSLKIFYETVTSLKDIHGKLE